MEFEAPPCQSIKRAATAPVEGQEATRLARGRTGDGMTFYDGRPPAASACEVGDCGTDRATTADHDTRARTHSSYLCQSWLPSFRAALVERWPHSASMSRSLQARRSPPANRPRSIDPMSASGCSEAFGKSPALDR